MHSGTVSDFAAFGDFSPSCSPTQSTGRWSRRRQLVVLGAVSVACWTLILAPFL